MNSKLDRRGNSIAFDIARYLEVRKRRVDEPFDRDNFPRISDGYDAYRVITTVLLEAVGIYLLESSDLDIEAVEGLVLSKSREKDAITSILEDFSLFLRSVDPNYLEESILRSFRERESEFNAGVYSYDSRSESSGKVG